MHTIPYITLHYVTLRYVTLHTYIQTHRHTYRQTLHYITLHCIALHYITLPYHYITLHYLHYISFHFITLHYIALNYITLHTYIHAKVIATTNTLAALSPKMNSPCPQRCWYLWIPVQFLFNHSSQLESLSQPEDTIGRRLSPKLVLDPRPTNAAAPQAIWLLSHGALPLHSSLMALGPRWYGREAKHLST